MSNEIIKDDFNQVYSIIELHRRRALQEVNNNSLFIAWNVGAYVSAKIKSSEWGSGVVSELSEFLRTKDPDLKGYSRRTIYKMVQFYDAYSSADFSSILDQYRIKERLKLPSVPDNEIVPFEMAQITDKNLDSQIVPTETAQLSEMKFCYQFVPTMLAQFPNILLLINWTCHQQILSNCKSYSEKLFYILYSYKEKLQVKELQRAIKSNTYESVLGSKDFQSLTLQNIYPDSKYLFKDTAYLDFLGLPERYKESKLRKSLVEHMKQFILELGKDFIFIGQEHVVEVGGKPFKIDLLFFHRGLQCLVAVELKTVEFEPSFMGQLEFYLEALDQTEKRSNENPSIGILLCKEANREVVRYALNRSMSPTMIAEYKEKLIPQEVLQRTMDEFIFALEQKSGKIL